MKRAWSGISREGPDEERRRGGTLSISASRASPRRSRIAAPRSARFAPPHTGSRSASGLTKFRNSVFCVRVSRMFDLQSLYLVMHDQVLIEYLVVDAPQGHSHVFFTAEYECWKEVRPSDSKISRQALGSERFRRCGGEPKDKCEYALVGGISC